MDRPNIRPEKARNTELNVFLYQPRIPHYRRPLFSALARERDFEMTVAAPLDAGDEYPKKETRIDFQNLRKCNWFGSRIIIHFGVKLPSHFGPGDVVVVPGMPRNIPIYPLIINARRRGIGIVWWGHAWSATSTPRRAKVRFRMMRYLADVWLLYSDVEKELCDRMGFPSDRTFSTNNTIDERLVDSAIAKWDSTIIDEFIRSNGLENRSRILFCGRLTKKTYISILIESLRKIRIHIPDILLLIIGEGEIKLEIEELVHEFKLSSNVRFLGAIWLEEELAPWYLTSKLFVYPGSIGLSLNHAFSYGLPVVTHENATEQMPEFFALRDGENGMLFKQHDSDDLADKICEILNDEHKRATMADAAFRTVRDKLSMERMVANFAEAVRAASRMATEKSS